MSKYTFIYEHDDGTKLVYEGNKETIYELAYDFAHFLRGVSYSDHLIKQILVESEEIMYD